MTAEGPELRPAPAGAGRARTRRGLVGPFTGRQIVVVVAVVAVAAVGLNLATRPLGTVGGGPSIAPAPTAYVVGPATEGLAVGQLAPELEVSMADGGSAPLTDLDGNPIRLADLRGRLVWLNFWASWCPPCQYETPALREMDERYADRGLTIVAVAVQETTVEDVRAYAARYELGFTIAFDTRGDVFDRYRANALPTQFFIAPDGRILEVFGGPLTREAAVARIEAWLPAVTE